MKAPNLLFALIIGIALLSSCTKENDDPVYDPPADHTLGQDGYLHKPGLNDPLSNCISCHGADLTGGSTGVSCFECHGAKWQ